MSDDLTTAYLLGAEQMRDKLHKQADAIERLRAENETLRRDVKTAIMGDSAELQDVKRENERLRKENERLEDTRIEFIGMINKLIDERVTMRKALNPFAYYASQIPDDVSDTAAASGTVGDLRAAAAALKETGDE